MMFKHDEREITQMLIRSENLNNPLYRKTYGDENIESTNDI